MEEYLPIILTAIMGTALATKLIKNGYETGMAAVSGIFLKMPPSVTRLLAVFLASGIAVLEGNAPATDAAVGAISGAILTAGLALLAKYKPERVPE